MSTSAKFKFVEREDVSLVWKFYHISILVCAALLGMCSGIILSLLTDDPLLCTKVFLERTDDSGLYVALLNNNTYVKLILSVTFVSSCEFSQFAFVSSFIFACIWAVFFLMCGPGGKTETGLPQPWRIVFPALVFSIIFSSVALGAALQVTTSIHEFCSDFDAQLASIRNETVGGQCNDLDLFYQVANLKSIKVQSLLLAAEIIGWLCAGAWGLSAGLCILRICCAPDFRPVVIPTAMKPPPNNSSQLYEELHNSSSPILTAYKSEGIAPSTSTALIHASGDEPDKIFLLKEQRRSVPNMNTSETNVKMFVLDHPDCENAKSSEGFDPFYRNRAMLGSLRGLHTVTNEKTTEGITNKKSRSLPDHTSEDDSQREGVVHNLDGPMSNIEEPKFVISKKEQ